jgi:hypothetical protein
MTAKHPRLDNPRKKQLQDMLQAHCEQVEG